MAATHPETKQLAHLLAGVEHRIAGEMLDTDISGLCTDSRKVQPGDLFAALQGLTSDGHDYIAQALAAGCHALLVNHDQRSKIPDETRLSDVVIVEVKDTKVALGYIAANFYDHPQRQLTLIGITGTNGKTTTSFLVESILSACGKRPGVIGTVNYRYVDKDNKRQECEAPLTTPDSPTLFALLRKMADADTSDVIMEVSSHALAQARLSGLAFDIVAFTNLSRDHLDFHPDMDHYFYSKKMLFTDHLKPKGRIILVLENTESRIEKSETGPKDFADWGELLHRELRSRYKSGPNVPMITTCGLDRSYDIHPLHYTADIDGIITEIASPPGTIALKTPLVGEFNLQNILCAIGIGLAHHEEPACLKKGIEDLKYIPGRLERIALEKPAPDTPKVFVDYAHTPDALDQVLTAIRRLKPKRIICVFGCGGDRDPGKRTLMGKAAGKLCDIVLATSDNPRSESPELILEQIEAGLRRSGLERAPATDILQSADGRGYDIIAGRRMAISTAIRFARPEDVVLISGKGHENYQISSAGKIFFDDRIEAEMQLLARAGAPFCWKLEWVQQITGGHLLFPVKESATFRSISTDTRTIQPGDLFVGLMGENFDGRKFAQKAVANGAAGLLINQRSEQHEPVPDFQPSVPVILVKDTVIALGQLAGFLRRWHNELRVAAITGSSGKTTVKEMAGAILSQNHSVLKTEGNFNNLIGLPLTLFNLKPAHEIAVLEMGMNRPGEIARLTEIADPDVACIINIQEAHLEGLGDIQGVAKAKNELYEGLKPEAKVAVNLDDEMVRSLAQNLTQEKITFGCHPEAFVRASGIRSRAEEGMEYILHIGKETRRVFIRGLGKHNVSNSLAAGALAFGCGSGIDEIRTGLESFKPYEKRARLEELPSGLKVLNDCYNANPASMQAALETLADLKKERRAVAVLADMLELGAKSETAHTALGLAVKELEIDFLATFGNQAVKVVAAAKNAGMNGAAARSFSDKREIASWLQDLLQTGRLKPGDWILIKGSRGMRMEEVLELLHNINSGITAEGN